MIFNLDGRLIDTCQIHDITPIEVHTDNMNRFTGGEFTIYFLGGCRLQIVTNGYYFGGLGRINPTPKDRILLNIYDKERIEKVYKQVVDFWKGDQSKIPQVSI